MNKTIPVEILKEIFKNLEEHNDLFVSKSWHPAAQELLKNRIHIFVCESELSRMLEGIPSLGYKVKPIILKDRPGDQHNRKANSLIFQEIYMQCPNIVSLFFKFTNIYQYLNNLHNSKADLSLLDNIDVDNFARCSFQTQKIYAYLHCYHTTTFKSLTMEAGNDCWKYGLGSHDVDRLISCYPKLTTFKILGENLKRNTLHIDLINTFELAPQLQEVIIQQVKVINSDMPPDDELVIHPQVTKLSLKTSEMDLNSLKYIVIHLKKIKYLYLDIDKLIPDTALSENESIVLFNDLISHTIKIK